jgi:hypothetical protein
VLQTDDAHNVGLLMWNDSIPADLEATLSCLTGSRVAVETAGLLESYHQAELQDMFPELTIASSFNWHGVISRY